MAEEQTREIKVSPEQLQEMYQQEINKFESANRRKNNLLQILTELNAVENTLITIQKEKNSHEILLPLGAGYYIEGTLKNPDKIKNYITGKVVIEKKAEETLKDVETRKKEITEAVNTINKEQEALSNNIRGLQQILMQSQQAMRQDQENKKGN